MMMPVYVRVCRDSIRFEIMFPPWKIEFEFEHAPFSNPISLLRFLKGSPNQYPLIPFGRKKKSNSFRNERCIVIKITHTHTLHHHFCQNLMRLIPLDRPRKICRLSIIIIIAEVCAQHKQTSMTSHCKCFRMSYKSRHNSRAHTPYVNHLFRYNEH